MSQWFLPISHWRDNRTNKVVERGLAFKLELSHPGSLSLDEASNRLHRPTRPGSTIFDIVFFSLHRIFYSCLVELLRRSQLPTNVSSLFLLTSAKLSLASLSMAMVTLLTLSPLRFNGCMKWIGTCKKKKVVSCVQYTTIGFCFGRVAQLGGWPWKDCILCEFDDTLVKLT